METQADTSVYARAMSVKSKSPSCATGSCRWSEREASWIAQRGKKLTPVLLRLIHLMPQAQLAPLSVWFWTLNHCWLAGWWECLPDVTFNFHRAISCLPQPTCSCSSPATSTKTSYVWFFSDQHKHTHELGCLPKRRTLNLPSITTFSFLSPSPVPSRSPAPPRRGHAPTPCRNARPFSECRALSFETLM